MNLAILNLSSVQLRRAAELKERIDSLQQELEEILGTNGQARRSSGVRNMSAAGRARIAAAARARWAKYRSEHGLAAPGRAPKQKRQLSAAGRAAIVAAAKARWARARAGKR